MTALMQCSHSNIPGCLTNEISGGHHSVRDQDAIFDNGCFCSRSSYINASYKHVSFLYI